MRAAPCVPLFGLAPGGVYPATDVATSAVRSYRTISPLPPKRRYIFCGTFRRLTPPRCYLAPCPMEPGLSSPCGAIVWPTSGVIMEKMGVGVNEKPVFKLELPRRQDCRSIYFLTLQPVHRPDFFSGWLFPLQSPPLL